MGQRKMEQQVKRTMFTEAEFLRDAFKCMDASAVKSVMAQFSDRPREIIGQHGSLWKLSDGSDLILNDHNDLIAAPRLRHL